MPVLFGTIFGGKKDKLPETYQVTCPNCNGEPHFPIPAKESHTCPYCGHQF